MVMQQDRINIVLASDENYALWMGIVIYSALEKSHCSKNICFYVIDGGISIKKKELLKNMVANFEADIFWISPSQECFQGFPIKRYGIATYYRLVLGRLLPAHVSKVIYFDCDILVVDNVEELWRSDLYGNVIGAVENLGIASSSLNIDRQSYFNAGMLLIDLNQWRKDNIDEKLMLLMEKYGDRYRYLDQDALNVAFQNSWTRLPLKWNMQPSIWSKIEKSEFHVTSYEECEYRSAIANPGVVHFLAKSKPWYYMTQHPYKDTYFRLFRRVFEGHDFYGNISWQSKVKSFFSIEKKIKNKRRISMSKKISFH